MLWTGYKTFCQAIQGIIGRLGKEGQGEFRRIIRVGFGYVGFIRIYLSRKFVKVSDLIECNLQTFF